LKKKVTKKKLKLESKIKEFQTLKQNEINIRTHNKQETQAYTINQPRY